MAQIDLTPALLQHRQAVGVTWLYHFQLIDKTTQLPINIATHRIIAAIFENGVVRETLKINSGIVKASDNLSFSLVKDWIVINEDGSVTPPIESIAIGTYDVVFYIASTDGVDISPIAIQIEVTNQASDSIRNNSSYTSLHQIEVDNGYAINVNTIDLLEEVTTIKANYIQKVNGLKIITSNSTSPTEVPNHLGQIGVHNDANFNATYFIGRSKDSSLKWEKIYNYYALNDFLANYDSSNDVVHGSTVIKTLSGTLSSINEVPLRRGQIGVLPVGTVEYFFVARTTNATTGILRWVLLITDSILFVSISALTDTPAFRGQIASFGGNTYLAIATTTGATTNWQLIFTEANSFVVLTSNNTNPTEVPLRKGVIGVYNDANFNATYFISRSTSSGQKWEKIYNYYALNDFVSTYLTNYVTTNDVVHGSTVIKTLTGTLSSINEVPLRRGQIGVLVVGTVEYFFVARTTNATTGILRWVLLITDSILFVSISALTDTPAFRGQIASFGGNAYLAIATTTGATTNWQLIFTEANSFVVLTSNNTNPTEVPLRKGVIGVYNDANFNATYFISRSTSSTIKWEKIYNYYALNDFVSTYLTNYVTTNDVVHGSTVIKTLTGSLTSINEVPLRRGQIGVLPVGSAEYFFVARTTNATTGILRWVLLITDSILFVSISALTDTPAFRGQIAGFGGNTYLAIATTNGAITNWQLIFTEANSFVVLTSNNTNPTEVPLRKGVIGVYNDANFNATYFISRSVGATQKWEKIYNYYALNVLLNDNNIAMKSFVANETFQNQGIMVSKIATEVYAHSSYCMVIGDIVYIIYMYNETEIVEGGEHQYIRLVSFNIYEPSVKIFYDVATSGNAIDGGGTIGGDISGPNFLRKSDGNIRCFFRQGGVGYYRDFDISNFTFSITKKVRCIVQDNGVAVDLNVSNAYSHLNYLFGVGHGMGDSVDMFMTSDFVMNDGKHYGVLSVGSGLGLSTTSILIESTDEGITWRLMGAADSRLLPGITGIDNKYMWEGAIIFDATYCYMYCRSGINGLQMVKAPIGSLFSFSSPTKMNDTCNAKPTVLKWDTLGVMLIVEAPYASLVQPNVTSNRTAVEIFFVNSTHTVVTKKVTLRDYTGLHSFNSTIVNDEVYVSYTTGVRKKHLKNCSEIKFNKIPRRWFV